MADEDPLAELLQRIRGIAELDDEPALEDTARLLDEILLPGLQLSNLRSDLENVRQESASLLSLVKSGTDAEWSRIDGLRQRASELGRWWPQQYQQELLGDIQEVRQQAAHTVDEADYRGSLTLLAKCLSEPIINSQQVPRILRDLMLVEACVAKRQDVPANVHHELRAARERAARYRAKQSMKDAEVADAG